MTKNITENNFWELFEEAQYNGESAYQSDELETIWKYPKQLGQGYTREFSLRSGLDLLIEDRIFPEHLILKVPEEDLPICMSFNIVGNFRCDCAGYVCLGQHLLFGSGIEPKEDIEYPAEQRIIRIDIAIESQLLEMFIGQPELPPALQLLVRGTERRKLFGTTTSAMQLALQQIWHCPYQGLTKRMYLESKVMELLALQSEQLLEDQPKLYSSPQLRTGDIDRIYQAKDILIQSWDNPPSIPEISGQVGLNRRKLNEGFQQVFGTTPFGYLRDYRLVEARRLLEEQEMTVREVASAVGYANQSRFTVAFRKKFGINPKSYQLQRGRREI